MSQQKRTDNRGKAKNGNDGMPQPIALLSNTNPDRIGLFQGRLGTFTRIQRNAANSALLDMQIVVGTMDGQANARNSIPDVRAQELCFRYMLGHINDHGAAIGDVHNQWRGALCVYILQPWMQFFGPTPQTLQWKHIASGNLNISRDRLGEMLCDTLNLSVTPAGVEWYLLTINLNAQQFPILSFSPNLLAVPATELPPAEEIRRVFPWTDKENHFLDPIKRLSVEALETIDRWLEFSLQNLQGDAHAAGQVMRNDVQERLGELGGEPPCPEVWETLLQALLLRDLVPADVTVFSTARNVRKDLFEHAMAEAPADNAPSRTWREITRDFEYGVALGGSPVGFLDKQRLLWLPAPGYLMETEAFRKLQGTMQRAMANADTRNAFAYRLEQLLAGNFTLPTMLLNRLNTYRSDGRVHQVITFSPTLRRIRRNEVTLLNEPFELLSSFCGYRCADQEPFTQGLCIYASAGDAVYENDRYSRWSAVHATKSGVSFTGGQGDGPAMLGTALLPLTACGATLVRNAEALNYLPNLEIRQDGDTERISAKLQIKLGMVVYEWSRNYEQAMIRNEEPTSMPAIGYWPNGAANTNEPPWKLYYTYVHFNESRDPIQLASTVYDFSGNRLSAPATKVTLLQDANGIRYAWQTHATNRLPSFCTLEENGGCLGCVLFGTPALFPAMQHQALLAVDFGTTSTTGAAMPDTTQPNNIVIPMFTTSVIRWETNATKGVLWSLEQFIADKFNCISKTGGEESFFTALARFSAVKAVELSEDGEAVSTQPTAQGNVLFTDGHIYYYGNTIHDNNPMGNRRMFGLKLQDIENPDGFAGGNVSLFLQQVVEMYLLYCRMNGATALEIRFAFPLAFQQERRKAFQQRVKQLVSIAGAKAGMPECSASFTSESQAVCDYFSHINNIKAGDLRQGIITLDVGGGTADYSYCRVIPKQTPLCDLYSNYFGGHRLVGEYAYRFKKLMDAGRRDALDWFVDGLRKAELTSTQEERNDLEAFQNAITAQHEKDKNAFIFLIERFISLKPDLYRAALLTPEFQEQYLLLLFELMLLLWFGYQLGTQMWAQAVQEEVRIFVGGNGAKLFKMVTESDMQKVISIINDGQLVKLDMHINPWLKREVAEGLLKRDALNPGEICPLSENTRVLPEALWNAFLELIQRFVQEFEGRNSRMVDYLKGLVTERKKNTRERFLRENANLKDLCAYLPGFCDIIIEDLVTKTPRPTEKGDTV